MKRSREQERELESITMASYLILIARVTKSQPSTYLRSDHNVFESKTCNRQFQSFQALGGHSPSHKKPRVPVLVTADDKTAENHDSSVKARAHECSVCGLEFATGQALGGHMRRHRAHLHGSDQHRRQDHQPSPLSLSCHCTRTVGEESGK
ncbi:hypothetical protein Nepgr_013389 [Nepenthes gracilis]|uniref:C2H2-type domain-containing protein n=1 Tax=Nepenthes gracilis TaxID=150966 RepID=A0AAD3XNY3_NEPGR|nr:hypothetical protein Nepgr_013389 [Nepenthes gracilis]